MGFKIKVKEGNGYAGGKGFPKKNGMYIITVKDLKPGLHKGPYSVKARWSNYAMDWVLEDLDEIPHLDSSVMVIDYKPFNQEEYDRLREQEQIRDLGSVRRKEPFDIPVAKAFRGESFYSQGNRDGRKYAPMKTQESFPNRAAFLSYKKGYNEALDGIYEETGDQLDNSPKNTEKHLNNSKKESSMKTYECSMQKKIESLAKKRSEKRTVTKSYDVYTYDELSDDAKAKVKDLFLQWRGEDGDIFKEDCENSLAEMFPNSDLKVQYSLTYSQGDGFNTYGTLNIKDLLNADFSKYPLNDSGITAPANKDAILAACNKADVYDIDLEENRRYGYSLADRLEVIPNNDEDLTDEDTALLSDLENFAREVMEAINSKFEKNGYDYFYEMSEDEVRDMADANEYEFTEDGELA